MSRVSDGAVALPALNVGSGSPLSCEGSHPPNALCCWKANRLRLRDNSRMALRQASCRQRTSML